VSEQLQNAVRKNSLVAREASSSAKPKAARMLELKEVTLRFGGVRALNGVSMHVNDDELLSLIGPNGAGKSSLLNCISGFYRYQAGEITFLNEPLKGLAVHQVTQRGVVRTFQGTQLFTNLTVVENLLVARHSRLGYNIADAFLWWQRARKAEARERAVVEQVIEFLGIEPYRNATVGSLAYGIRKRVDLGRALAMEPRILMLDEPMAGLNIEEKEDVARFILDIREAKRIPVVLIEHDMGVVMDISDRIVVLQFGTVIATGTASQVQANVEVQSAYLGTAR
jgi:branched-chain amino acid transport system ATP-binding protein